MRNCIAVAARPWATAFSLSACLVTQQVHAQTLRHDANGRLTSAQLTDGSVIHYTYDTAGNLAQKTRRLRYLETAWHTVWFFYSNNFTPVRVNLDGEIECASSDGVNCFWGTAVETMPYPSNPIQCTAQGLSDSGHWCAQLAAVLDASWTHVASYGKQYAVVNCGNWMECESKAKFVGGNLVAIGSDAENDWLVSQFPMNLNYWIGATNDGVPGNWRWTSGETFGYIRWGNNLNNFDGQEFCAHFYDVTPGYWNDIRCDSPGLVLGLFQKPLN